MAELSRRDVRVQYRLGRKEECDGNRAMEKCPKCGKVKELTAFGRDDEKICSDCYIREFLAELGLLKGVENAKADKAER